MNEINNIPASNQRKRIVIVGAGFAGIKLVLSLSAKHFQVILLDKNNYHQFQPLFYQVATAGLEPSSISFPIRKILQKRKNVHFRVASLQHVNWESKSIETDIGSIEYDDLVLSLGGTTNFFGNPNLEKYAVPMKSVSEALYLRNAVLENYEQALNTSDPTEQEALMNIVITGGGPTGVELSGALAEMRKFVLPKDYPELDFTKMTISLLEGSPRLLNGMSDYAGRQSLSYLKKLGVEVRLNCLVEDFDGTTVSLKGGEKMSSKTLLWAAGIKANSVKGFSEDTIGPAGRILVNEFSQTKFSDSVYVIGDQALMITAENPKGDPQVAQVAIQQAQNVAKNLNNLRLKKQLKAFKYFDKGSMATVGRNLAVADLAVGSLKGHIAWLMWLFVHLMAILGTKNKVFVFLNWIWSYITYDQSLRLMIKPREKK
ncbi:MAG: NAD(P)/FAD-dependent oxidoreductase [Salibacteraceae bacterium]|nr:NAD(P)/FAD-dependent oxidoreductase [Salibacteraceae bacterium]|tara:strand:- start:1108 stop:2394 length:1287 start_codon:yes stop_codon:yes gene_type:complete